MEMEKGQIMKKKSEEKDSPVGKEFSLLSFYELTTTTIFDSMLVRKGEAIIGLRDKGWLRMFLS